MRCIIFIDGGNLFHSVKRYNNQNNTNVKIDYTKLSQFLTTETKSHSHLRTYYYTGVPVKLSNKQQGFITKLDLLPNLAVKKKTLKIKNERLVEKGIDVMIVTDMLWCGFQKHCEHIILVSGDEDLTEAVSKLKDNGIRVTIAAFKNNASPQIIRNADSYIDLTKYVKKFEK